MPKVVQGALESPDPIPTPLSRAGMPVGLSQCFGRGELERQRSQHCYQRSHFPHVVSAAATGGCRAHWGSRSFPLSSHLSACQVL